MAIRQGIYLYKTTTVMDGLGTQQDLLLAVGGDYTHPTSDGIYRGIGSSSDLKTGLIATQSIYSDRLAFGFGALNRGVLQCVAPESGEYDYLRDVGFGQLATIKFGYKDAAFSTFETVFSGIASNAEVNLDSFQIGWQDSSKLLDNPVSDGVFAGTNSGASGYEGLATDIKGQRKPRAWGVLPDIEPVLLNSATRTYGWNYTRAGLPKASLAVTSVRVRGFSWTNAGDYPNAAALNSASLTTGFYGTCLAESKLRMGGSSPIDGSVRISVTVSNDKAPVIIENLLLDAGVSNSDISSADIVTLASLRNYTVGVYATDQTFRELVDDVLKSILAWCNIDYLGVYRFGFIPLSVSGSVTKKIKKLGIDVVGDINTFNIVDLSPIIDSNTNNVPAKSVKVGYFQRKNPPSRDSLASGLSDEVKSTLSQEWRYTTIAENAATKIQYDNADDVEWFTLLSVESEAQAIRDALLAIIGKRQHRYSVTIFSDVGSFSGLRVGDRVNLYYDRFGMNNGKQMFITELYVDVSTGYTELGLLEIGNV